MEFWGVEVKSGQPLEVTLGEGKVLHLSQACLGEIKKDKSNESVCLHITVEEKKLVLGTLHSERLPQQLFDLVFDKDFKISHNWKNGSVYFYGYKADQPSDEQEDSEDFDSEEEDALQLPIANGKQEAKKEEKPVVPSKKDVVPKASAAGKQKVKIVEPEKDTKSEGNDSDDDDSDDSDAMSEDSDDAEDNEDSSDDEEEDSDEDEETPKKQQSGKKRPNESAIKTPSTDKKAKLSTPQKTEGKKGGGHVATPHPSKQAVAKTPANKSNQKSPASEGAFSCKSCNRSFKTDGALQSHNQAKHSK